MKGILTKLRQVPKYALISVCALAIIYAVLVALTTLVASGLFLLNLPSLDPATFKDVIANVQAAFTIGAIVVAGLFAIFKVREFRDFEPHLSISQEVSHRLINNIYVHIDVTSTLYNSSKVRVDVREGFFLVQQVLPVTDKEIERIRAQVFVYKTQVNLQWDTLDKASRTWKENEFVVEPGESLRETCEFLIPSNVESVLVYTYIYNSKKIQGSQAAPGWAAITVYDIVKRPSA